VGVENGIDEKEFDQFDEIPPFTTSMIKPRIPSIHTCATTTMKKLRISKNQERNRK
jgi:hypothetical protein